MLRGSYGVADPVKSGLRGCGLVVTFVTFVLMSVTSRSYIETAAPIERVFGTEASLYLIYIH